ncbi:TetR family transcriptional regulator [Thalassobius sp. I31.1]|uniref:TetR family transcriptional regulator n=1 Tax=Thalassobius sp. I31.1 TaxID=2109912 RepID=UPI0018E4F4F2|nr:TetR family transcriptional regulator [Thalassobius sp. I31.1]
MSFQRARQADQIAERRSAILQSARDLCAEFGVMGWSLNELGRRADVTKSNLYRYFESREEILLVLMHEETHKFACDFAARTKNQKMTVPELSALLADFYARQPMLCDLLCVSSSILEHNIELKKIRDIKMAGFEDAQVVNHAISSVLENISEAQAARISLFSGIVVAGLWPMTRPNAPAQQLATFDGFEGMAMSFQGELSELLEAQISGFTANQNSHIAASKRS